MRSRGFWLWTFLALVILPFGFWAPQKLILGHPAAAAFVSHCGWNSTLESVFGGIPIVAWPMFAEQKINATSSVRQELAVMAEGTEIKATQIFSAEKIVALLEQVTGKNGEQSKYWKNAQEWKKKFRKAQEPGGSSFENFHQLMKFKS